MASKGKRAWKRRWVTPRVRCHGGGVCCITRYLKAAPGSRRMARKAESARVIAEQS